MKRWLIRMFWLTVVGGVGYVAWAALTRRRSLEPPSAAWPPLDPPDPTERTSSDHGVARSHEVSNVDASPAEPRADRDLGRDPGADTGESTAAEATQTGSDQAQATGTATPDGRSTWVAPHDDGSCPLSHPIKANDSSHIYHRPDGRFYDRTQAERCYLDASSAEADGYRASKA